MQAILKTLEDYRRLPYTLYREPVKDSDGTKYWVAQYIELQGCKTEGDSEAEAIENLQELFDEYISLHIEKGTEIPEPEKATTAINETLTIISKEKMVPSIDLKAAQETEETTATIPQELEYAVA